MILLVQISTNSGLYNDVSHIENSFGGGANFILIKKVVKNLDLNNSKTARVQILILSAQISTN